MNKLQQYWEGQVINAYYYFKRELANAETKGDYLAIGKEIFWYVVLTPKYFLKALFS